MGSSFHVDRNIGVFSRNPVLEVSYEFRLKDALDSRVLIFASRVLTIRSRVLIGELRRAGYLSTSYVFLSFNLSISFVGNVNLKHSFYDVFKSNNPNYLDL